jgi:hypothetical protein
VLRQAQTCGIQIRVVAAGPRHSRLGIVGNHQSSHTAEKLKAVHVRANPVLQLLAPGSFSVGVVAGSQDGDKQRGFMNGAILRIVDGNPGAGPVYKQLLSRVVLLSHHQVALLLPLLIVITKPAITVALGMPGPVFFPEQLQRGVLVLLQCKRSRNAPVLGAECVLK